MKHYFSVGETARALGVTERTVWNYIKKGELKTVKKKYRKTGRERIWIELLSLEKCLIRKKYPAIYGTKVSLLLDYAERHGDIADPWYTGDFTTTYFDIVRGCEGFLTFLEQEGKL